jgi:hypothetical protein
MMRRICRSAMLVFGLGVLVGVPVLNGLAREAPHHMGKKGMRMPVLSMRVKPSNMRRLLD